MAEVWFTAFGLLALLTVANSILLVAMMRQVGVLHQRVPPTGPGSVGPESGTSFKRLDLSPVPGTSMDGFGTAPVTVLAYVTPSCGLCERIPGFLEAYIAAAPAHERALISFAFATDAPEFEAIRFREQHDGGIPLVCHPRLVEHYELAGVGAPYLLALANIEGSEGGEQLLLAGGIVNTLEQLEDLIEIALHHYAAHVANYEELRANGRHSASHEDAGPTDDRLSVNGGG